MPQAKLSHTTPTTALPPRSCAASAVAVTCSAMSRASIIAVVKAARRGCDEATFDAKPLWCLQHGSCDWGVIGRGGGWNQSSDIDVVIRTTVVLQGLTGVVVAVVVSRSAVALQHVAAAASVWWWLYCEPRWWRCRDRYCEGCQCCDDVDTMGRRRCYDGRPPDTSDVAIVDKKEGSKSTCCVPWCLRLLSALIGSFRLH